MQEAVKGFGDLPEETKKPFIYTGNALNEGAFVLPTGITLGVGKTVGAYLIQTSDLAYGKKGWR